MDPSLAVMVACPFLWPEAVPPALMVATVALLEVQVTELVKFLVVPLLYFPVAVNRRVDPRETDALNGVREIDCRVGEVVATTAKVVEAEIEPEVAVIVTLPVVAAFTKPLAEMLATDELLDVQTTEPVRF